MPTHTTQRCLRCGSQSPAPTFWAGEALCARCADTLADSALRSAPGPEREPLPRAFAALQRALETHGEKAIRITYTVASLHALVAVVQVALLHPELAAAEVGETARSFVAQGRAVLGRIDPAFAAGIDAAERAAQSSCDPEPPLAEPEAASRVWGSLFEARKVATEHEQTTPAETREELAQLADELERGPADLDAASLQRIVRTLGRALLRREQTALAVLERLLLARAAAHEALHAIGG